MRTKKTTPEPTIIESTAMQAYCFDGHAIRQIGTPEAPWFIASDVAAVLGIAQVASTLRSFPASEKGMHTMHTLGGAQTVTVINEAGLYRMIFQSRKAEAEAFKTWVFTEVLPAIRRTGSYQSTPQPSIREAILEILPEIVARVIAALPPPPAPQAPPPPTASPAAHWEDQEDKGDGWIYFLRFAVRGTREWECRRNFHWFNERAAFSHLDLSFTALRMHWLHRTFTADGIRWCLCLIYEEDASPRRSYVVFRRVIGMAA